MMAVLLHQCLECCQDVKIKYKYITLKGKNKTLITM